MPINTKELLKEELSERFELAIEIELGSRVIASKEKKIKRMEQKIIEENKEIEDLRNKREENINRLKEVEKNIEKLEGSEK